mmetsp:Transcript_15225/g.26589  ORF Transcript_15225/g.26589 Transcript_15225/m.26589 type:complete len:627 (+) Transcript_15225:291-2171(+)
MNPPNTNTNITITTNLPQQEQQQRPPLDEMPLGAYSNESSGKLGRDRHSLWYIKEAPNPSTDGSAGGSQRGPTQEEMGEDISVAAGNLIHRLSAKNSLAQSRSNSTNNSSHNASNFAQFYSQPGGSQQSPNINTPLRPFPDIQTTTKQNPHTPGTPSRMLRLEMGKQVVEQMNYQAQQIAQAQGRGQSPEMMTAGMAMTAHTGMSLLSLSPATVTTGTLPAGLPHSDHHLHHHQPSQPQSPGGASSQFQHSLSASAMSHIHSHGSTVHKVMAEAPRILIVSRGFVRKGKVVDFVGEYHMELLVRYGLCPIMVPRVDGIAEMLDSFEPFHGLLLIEGQDIDPALYPNDGKPNDILLGDIQKKHGDTILDTSKDAIEFELARRSYERGIPFLGICRGSQIMNVLAGGTLFADVESEIVDLYHKELVSHIDYENYDGHRHPIDLVHNTPLYEWFQQERLMVNSYHHQGVKRLASRFKPMAHSPDGLIEAFYDESFYDPFHGKFVVGLQFHPERLRNPDGSFEYEACPTVYERFGEACFAYKKNTWEQLGKVVEKRMEAERFRLLSKISGVGSSQRGVQRSNSDHMFDKNLIVHTVDNGTPSTIDPGSSTERSKSSLGTKVTYFGSKQAE